MLIPRDYQQNAHDAVINWWKHTTDSCVVEAATGAGKSLIISMIARTLFQLSGGKRVLCLAPSAELIEQNSEKYRALGEKCSVYSASISKSLAHQVVFATELTFKAVAKSLGSQFSGVIIDEAHKITPTIKNIISDMKEGNPNLRVCGLSATPYRRGEGFIFAIDLDGNPIHESQARDPYFKKLVYYIGAHDLIGRGFLTKAIVGEINAKQYDTSGLVLQKNGQFSQKSVDQAFTGWGRETASIVADIVTQSQGKRGVMIFAATVDHAKEIMASLPPELSRMIGGNVNMKTAERKKLVRDFKLQRFKYLVNVRTMTTGVDFTHVSVVAIMAATESVSLLQQIIGRGLRLHDGKEYCLILDYAGNIDKHCPDGDLFRPEIRAAYQGEQGEPIECACPECGGINVFSKRKSEENLPHNEHGYFVDLDGNEIIAEGTNKPMPAHYGRRCQQFVYSKLTKAYEQCNYTWSYKECPVCEHHNDIAARKCKACKEELINPNDKLIAIHKKHKKDPNQVQCDEVLEMEANETLSRSGNKMVRAQYYTPYRMVTMYYHPESKSQWVYDKYHNFMIVTDGMKVKPHTIKYKKNADGFYEILSYNEESDDMQLQRKLA